MFGPCQCELCWQSFNSCNNLGPSTVIWECKYFSLSRSQLLPFEKIAQHRKLKEKLRFCNLPNLTSSDAGCLFFSHHYKRRGLKKSWQEQRCTATTGSTELLPLRTPELPLIISDTQNKRKDIMILFLWGFRPGMPQKGKEPFARKTLSLNVKL